MEIFVDKHGRQLIVDKSAPTRLDLLRLGENIIEPIKLWLLDRPETAGLPLTASALEAPFTDLIVAARPATDLEGAELLFSCTDFTEVGEDEELHYEGLITLNVEALQTAMEGLKTLAVLLDVEMVNVDSTRNSRLVMHANGLVYRDIFRGDEGVPTDGDPAYPLPQNLLTVGTDTATIKRGTAAVANGAESKAIAFATAFDAPPTTVLAWLMVPAAGALIACAVDHSTITAAGFTALFGAATPNANYQLGWMAIA